MGGWYDVSGPTKSSPVNCIVSTLIIDGCNHVNDIVSSDSQLTLELSKFWETELIGIADHKPHAVNQFPPEFCLIGRRVDIKQDFLGNQK